MHCTKLYLNIERYKTKNIRKRRPIIKKKKDQMELLEIKKLLKFLKSLNMRFGRDKELMK